MYNLYENIYALCNERHMTPGGLCGELGFRRSVLSDLKSGRKKSLDTTTLVKIANYFDVSVDYLLTGQEKEKPPAESNGHELTLDDFSFAMHNHSGDLTDSDKDTLLKLAQQLADANRKKKKNGETH